MQQLQHKTIEYIQIKSLSNVISTLTKFKKKKIKPTVNNKGRKCNKLSNQTFHRLMIISYIRMWNKHLIIFLLQNTNPTHVTLKTTRKHQLNQNDSYSISLKTQQIKIQFKKTSKNKNTYTPSK